MRRLHLVLLIGLALQAASKAVEASEAASAKPKQVAIEGDFQLPDLPSKGELKFVDLPKCLAASSEAPRRIKEIEQQYAALEGQSKDLHAKRNALDATRMSLEAADSALARDAERIASLDADLATSRRDMDSTDRRSLRTRADVDKFNAKVAALNERIATRNREAQAFQARVAAKLARANDFGVSVTEFNSLAAQLRAASADYSSRSNALKENLAKLEAACAGERRLVR
jgi:chromosome segregation ATPase